jgi:hypothetical protein
MRIVIAVVLLLTFACQAVAAEPGAAKAASWLWPPPQRVEALDGGLPLKAIRFS